MSYTKSDLERSEIRGFKPLGDKLLILPDDPPTHVGKIIIPEVYRAKDPPKRGTVVAMGPGMLMKSGARWPMPECKPGDKVLFVRHNATVFEIAGKKHVIVRDDEVQAVLDESA